MRRAAVTTLGALLLAAAACADDMPAGTSAAPTDTQVTVPALELGVGECFDGLVVGAAERARVESVVPADCDQPHDLEVFHGFEFDAPGDGYPGEDTVVDLAEQGCADAFQEFLGERAQLGQVAIWPTEASWAEGDRVVLCAAYEISGGRLTGKLP